MSKQVETSMAGAAEAAIKSEWYCNAAEAVIPDEFQPPVPAAHPLRDVTICMLVLHDGRTVLGSSRMQGADGKDVAIHRSLARRDAMARAADLMDAAG